MVVCPHILHIPHIPRILTEAYVLTHLLGKHGMGRRSERKQCFVPTKICPEVHAAIDACALAASRRPHHGLCPSATQPPPRGWQSYPTRMHPGECEGGGSMGAERSHEGPASCSLMNTKAKGPL